MVRRLFAALIAAAILTPQIASAGSNLRIGSIELHPYYEVTESLDSNIYLVPPDQANGIKSGGGVLSSWITNNNAGLKAKWKGGNNYVNAGYDVSALTYTQQGNVNDAVNQKANITLGRKAGAWSSKIWDTYINTEDPAFSELVGRSQRWHNQAGATFGYAPEGGAGFLEVSGDHNNHKYLDSSPTGLASALNRFEQQVGIRGGYNLAPKTRLYVGYRRGIIHFSIQPNKKHNKTHYFDLGVEGKLANKLTGSIRSGVSARRYSDSSTAGRDNTTNLWNVSTSINWKPLARTSIGLNVRRVLTESTFGTNRYYISNSASLSASHKFPGKTTLKVGLAYGVDSYPESTTIGNSSRNRRDDNYRQSVGVDHKCNDWLGFGLNYEHKQRNSVFPGQFNYERHLTALSARVTF